MDATPEQTPLEKGETPLVSANELQIRPKSALQLPMQPAISSTLAIESWEHNLRMGSQPSKNRHIQSALAATATTTQRSGGALPSFIPKGASPMGALSIAKQIDPFDRVLNTVLSSRARSSIRRTVNNTHSQNAETPKYSEPQKGLVSNSDPYARGSRRCSR